MNYITMIISFIALLISGYTFWLVIVIKDVIKMTRPSIMKDKKHPIPKSVINKWYNVDVKAYEIAYGLAKERFDDISKESESITDKSIKITSGILIITAFYISIIINKEAFLKEHAWLLLLPALGVVGILIFMIMLILPKKVISRGLSPLLSFQHDFDNSEDINHQEKLIYFQSLSVLQYNIDYMTKRNKKRAIKYKWAIISSIGLFIVLIPPVIVYILLSEPII